MASVAGRLVWYQLTQGLLVARLLMIFLPRLYSGEAMDQKVT